MVVLLAFVSYGATIVVAYYSVLFVISLWSTRQTAEPRVGHDPFFVLVIPARNEQLVIAETVRRARMLDTDRHIVLIMNDGSTDETGAVARIAAEADERVIVVDRGPEVAGQGKGDVLNHAYRLINEWVQAGDARLRETPTEDVIVCVVDADGWLEPHAPHAVADYFADPKVGAVQLPVRMWNSRDGFLALMQDMEFIGFSLFVQAGRDPFNSVGLGGNGQFVRLSALQMLGAAPWSKCLTEDLDLGLSLVEAGWRNRLCPKACVAQQALSRVRPLLRQRTRWTQGHYSCWQHLPALWRAKSVPLMTKVDLSLYLMLVVFVLVLGAQLTIGVLAWTGLAELPSSYLGFVHNPQAYHTIALTLSFLPLLAFAATYQRYSRRPLPWWALPGCVLLFALYNYCWAVPASLRALSRIVLRRDSWEKTPRTASGARGPVGEPARALGVAP